MDLTIPESAREFFGMKVRDRGTRKSNMENRECQNCRVSFTIDASDLAFYEKLKVPPPTFCPKCRHIRRMIWRNQRTLYRRACEAPGHTEILISMYPPDSGIPVYDVKYWWSDEWDASRYGAAYDLSRTFFDQFKDLLHRMPLPNLVQTNCTNSEYTNSAMDCKNAYLTFAVVKGENVFYSSLITNIRDSSDVYNCHENELAYECMYADRCFRVRYGYFLEDCSDGTFLYDCRDCSSCFGCVGLRKKSHCFFNEQLSKEEYWKRIEALDMGSFRTREEMNEKFWELVRSHPVKYSRQLQCQNSTGDNLYYSKNCRECFDTKGQGLEDCAYVIDTYSTPSKSCNSIYGISNGEHCYDSISIRVCSNILFSKKIWTGRDVQYSYNCHDCSDIFGCIGLRKKQYCILNRQYSEEEYRGLVEKIKEHMREFPYVAKNGTKYGYGEFFPEELCPYGYNESVAIEYYPLNREEALARGYAWKDTEVREYKISKTIADIPDTIAAVEDPFCQEIIGCAHSASSEQARAGNGCLHQCTTAFRILPDELQLYKRIGVPIPRLCPNCRHFERLNIRNPVTLQHRDCMCDGPTSRGGVYANKAVHSHGEKSCEAEFETPYSSTSPTIVYCENCYQAEVA